MELLGWVSSVCLVVCGVPLAYAAIRSKSTGDISPLFILLWTVGEVAGLVYVWGDGPLTLNYGVNLLVCAVLCYYLFKGGDDGGR